MKKVYIVMDEPESCSVCPLFGDVYTDMVCNGNGYGINYPYPKDFRQEWCPLKPLPEKDVLEQRKSDIDSFKRGWNACIDRILEEAKAMKEVKHYICETCGTEYADKQKCIDCEKSHKKAVEIVKMRFLSMANNMKGYPHSIDVKMSDGNVVTYKR